jgi:hypothetical protein
MMNEIQVISRDAIPPVQSLDSADSAQRVGELRDFRWHALLREFMPRSADFSVSWVKLKYGEVLLPQAQATAQLLIFHAGAGTLLGETERPVAKDDVVLLPPGSKHGFVGGPDGLQGVAIQLGDDAEAASAPQEAGGEGWQALLAHNDKNQQAFRRRPLFDLLRDGTLDEPSRRRAFLGAMQVWFDAEPALLMRRLASCADAKYSRAFVRDIDDDFARTLRRHGRGERPWATASTDVRMAAFVSWFSYQMAVLDNAEKAVVELVVRSAISAYQSAAAPALAQFTSQRHFHYSQGRTSVGADLLRGQSAAGYARLRAIMDETWSMFAAMTDRVVELALSA